MELHCKAFDELTAGELHEILRVRCAVFVVEQNCPYQDVDDIDLQSLHIYLEENEKIAAYLRCFQQVPNTARIGRVLTMERGKGLGRPLMEAGIRAAKQQLHADKIEIEAQCYASGFYNKFGFEISGEAFLEDGIPHVPMTLTL